MELNLTKNLVLKTIETGLDIYNKAYTNQKFSVHTLTLNCDELVDLKEYSVNTKNPVPEEVKVSFFRKFDALDSALNKKNCLYYFSFDNRFNSSSIVECFKSKSGIERNMSAIKKSPDLNTKTLYVGKVKKGIGGRLSTHFGYANPKTGGLQLKYWAKDLKLELTITIIAFEDQLNDFLNPLELELTKELKPLIGKSK